MEGVMSDVLKRVRDAIGTSALCGFDSLDQVRELLHDAANEIERLRAATAALEETLRVARSDLEIEAHDAKDMAARLGELEAALAQNTAGLTEANVRLQRGADVGAGWRPVETCPPGPVCVIGGGAGWSHEVYRDGEGKFWLESTEIVEPTHWCHLPPPPDGAGVGAGWQPIETVPRDDTPVLMTDGEAFWVGRTDGEYWSVETTWPITENMNRDASHWMPLPPSPVGAEEAMRDFEKRNGPLY
jgi:hypothetical protein